MSAIATSRDTLNLDAPVHLHYFTLVMLIVSRVRVIEGWEMSKRLNAALFGHKWYT